ncbi:hypothetical protein LIER_31900 [Lithospermum erythrorhizon]|uniref:Uncharacterized protein n=1 Tax=Lithospermum erythrorhizon TaxID=34254 RepID=A0AAV3RTC4_LITER
MRKMKGKKVWPYPQPSMHQLTGGNPLLTTNNMEDSQKTSRRRYTSGVEPHGSCTTMILSSKDPSGKRYYGAFRPQKRPKP